MNLQDQVCTLEQAKRLKELGLTQDSLFSWCGSEESRIMDNGAKGMEVGGWLFVDRTIPYNNQHADHRDDVPSAKPFVAAPNVAELGVMLPNGFDTMQTTPDGWVGYDIDGVDVFRGYKTEAECRAQLLIWALETGFVTVEETNQRLLK